MQDWKNVQALIGKIGKESLKRRIQVLNVNKLKEDTVNRAKRLLEDIRLEDVVVISAGAATFYSWVNICIYYPKNSDTYLLITYSTTSL